MNFAPHKLFRIESLPAQVDENGDPVTNPGDTLTYLCDCFLHDVNTQIKQGYAGQGIDVTYYVNMDKRSDLAVNQEVLITEPDGETLRGSGKILDIKNTSGMHFAGIGEYTTIYI
ncbi:MAG: hypothetical protein LBS55_06520 [Prevotellaceae bacterium]|jgi:hypothetical protein|nr:hypothetical protein [Prevotellaceae bacterium]